MSRARWRDGTNHAPPTNHSLIRASRTITYLYVLVRPGFVSSPCDVSTGNSSVARKSKDPPVLFRFDVCARNSSLCERRDPAVWTAQPRKTHVSPSAPVLSFL